MMDHPVLAGCGLTRSDAAKVLPLVLLVCQRGCKWSANLLQIGIGPRKASDVLNARTDNRV